MFYVNDDVDQLKEWLKYSRGICINDVEIERCLYFIKKNMVSTISKNKNILKVKEDTTENFNAYYKYLTVELNVFNNIFTRKGGKVPSRVVSPTRSNPQGFVGK